MATQGVDAAGTEASFAIHPATRGDIPRLARVHVDACAADNAISLYFTHDDQFYDGVVTMLEGQIGDPAWTHVKAVDTATGTLAAWASWVEVPAQHDDAAIPSSQVKRDQPDAPQSKEEEEPVNFVFQPGLGTVVREDTARFFKAWAKGKRHYQLKALFTDKPFRRRGMATALIRESNKVADRTKTPVILQASPFGYPVYAANGYEVSGFLDVDLREWAPGAKGNDRGWGNYRYRYMTRIPQ